MKKIILTVILVFSIFAAVLSAGCSQSEKTLFSCKPDNLIGVNEIKIKGKTVTMFFDRELATRTDRTPLGAMNGFFKNGNAEGFEVVVFIDGKEQTDPKMEPVTVDAENCTISFEIKGVRASKLTGFRIQDKGPGFPFKALDNNFVNCTVDIKESKLSVSTAVEESSGWERPLAGYYARISTTYSQTYDKEKETWSDLQFKNGRTELWS